MYCRFDCNGNHYNVHVYKSTSLMYNDPLILTSLHQHHLILTQSLKKKINLHEHDVLSFSLCFIILTDQSLFNRLFVNHTGTT